MMLQEVLPHQRPAGRGQRPHSRLESTDQPPAGRGQRSHSTLGFRHEPTTGGKEKGLTDKAEKSFWKDQVISNGVRAASTSVIGRANAPAATFSYENRKKNLNPGLRGHLVAPSAPSQSMTKTFLFKEKPAYKIREMEREERAKTRQAVPAIVEKITAEKQIVDNPLLRHKDDQDDESAKQAQARNITALSLHDLCKLHIAFEVADVDGSGSLDQNEFVDAFLPVLGVDAADVHLLFMRIDADSDGGVTWEEFMSYVLSQDEGKLQIATEASRHLFEYPVFSDSALQIHGHKDSTAGLLHLEDTDRYVSFSRKGDVLVWRPECLESVIKIIHPHEFETNLPFITQIVHVKRMFNSDRVALCSADKQLVFLDLMRDNVKQTGQIMMDFSPLCMCTVIVRDNEGTIVDDLICFGDDQGQLHLFNTDKLNQLAERNTLLMNAHSNSISETSKPKDAHIKSWKAHEPHSWVAKVEYYDDARMLVSCASDGQLTINDITKGDVLVSGFRHRGDIADFVWLKKIQLLASCGLERHINLWQIPIKTPVYKLEGHQGPIQQLISAVGQLISIDTSKTIIIWDLQEMAPIQWLQGMKMHAEFAVGRMLYDYKRNGFITMARKPLLWSICERKVPAGHTAPVSSAAYNPMFQTLVSADEASVVRVWNLNTGQAVIRFTGAHVNKKGEGVKVTSTLFDHTHRRLITGAHDGSIKLWNFSTGVQLKELVGFGEGSEVTGLACIEMTPHNYILATGWNRKVTMWLDPQSMPEQKAAALPTQQHQTHWSSVKEDLLCMACYPDINLLATGAYDGDIIIWNQDTGTPRTHLVLPGLSSLKTEHKPIEAMQLVGIRGKSTCFRRTNLPENATLELTFEQKTANLSHKFPQKSKKSANLVVLLFTASGDGLIRIWSTDDTAELLLELPLEKDTVDAGICALASCEASKVLVAADNWGEVYVYDISGTMDSANTALPPTSEPLTKPVCCAKFKAHKETITALIYINTRRLIVTGCTDCTICLWTLMGEKMGTFGEQRDWKLTPTMHNFTKVADKAVFGKSCSQDMADEGASSKNEALRKKKERELSRKKTREISVRKEISQEDSKSSLGEAPDKSREITEIQGGKGDSSSSAFMTQLEEDLDLPGKMLPGLDGATSAEVEEDLDANWKDYYSSGSHSDDDIEDETVPISTEKSLQEARVRTELELDIQSIIARGLAMKERGEKFFDSGSREMGTYGKMIVRGLGEVQIPDKIQRKIMVANQKLGKRGKGRGSNLKVETEEGSDEDNDFELDEDASAAFEM